MGGVQCVTMNQVQRVQGDTNDVSGSPGIVVSAPPPVVCKMVLMTSLSSLGDKTESPTDTLGPSNLVGRNV